MKPFFRFFLPAALTVLSACGDKVSYGNIPEPTVNFSVYPYSMDNTLMAPGNYKYFNRGYAGVFVYHIGYPGEEYVAFERACPIDWEDGCYVEFNPDNLLLEGIRCKHGFDSYYGFSKTVKGFALRKLKVYNQNAQEIRITN